MRESQVNSGVSLFNPMEWPIIKTLCRRLVALMLRRARGNAQEGRKRRALLSMRKVVAAYPSYFKARLFQARLANEVAEFDEVRAALGVFDQGPMKLTARHHWKLASVYFLLDDFNTAKEHLLAATQADPDCFWAWIYLAKIHEKRAEIERSIECYRTAAELTHSVSQKVILLGEMATAMSCNGCEGVGDVYVEMQQLKPEFGYTYYGFVECGHVTTLDDPYVDMMHQLVASRTITPQSRRNLHFALGDLYDKCKDPARAFAHWSIANQIPVDRTQEFTAEGVVADADERIEVFTKELVDSLSAFGCDEEFLVCIVGSPRSGTTLVHEILAEFPSTRGLGERCDIWQLTVSMQGLLGTRERYPYCATRLKPQDIRRFAEMVKSRWRMIAGNSERIVTKLPNDAWEIGIIRILFPKAKFVYCRRNPIDVVMSCYKGNFTYLRVKDHPTTLAAYYLQTKRLMAYWKEVSPPGTIYDVSYETLVNQPEEVVRGLSEFIGVPFDPGYLQYHESSRRIDTMSRWQVREPIHKSAVNKYERYREFFGPLVLVEPETDPNNDHENADTTEQGNLDDCSLNAGIGSENGDALQVPVSASLAAELH